ncbi:hypothetical protein PG993_009949 [Apiospora rasikravindrae]|uniref:Uncharacterized protein n=1 Tax=Apiospora rasikravindrae TaxID=990691 RepID=A0ABR1SMM0_9PEZI
MQLANIHIANLDRDRTPYEECFPWRPLCDEARVNRGEKTRTSGATESLASLEYLTSLFDASTVAATPHECVPVVKAIQAEGQVDRPEDLSVAVEFKFLVPYRPHGAAETDDCRRHPPVATADMISNAATATDADRQRLQDHAFRAIAATIRACDGQDAISSHEMQQLPQSQPLSAYWATHWLVKRSNSAEPSPAHPHYGDWLWVPVEINSPKLSWTDREGTSETIRAVVRALHAGHRVETNYSCEVHVHMGRRDGRRLSLPSLQRLAVLCWLAEPVLRGVKDPRSPNFVHKYTWSSPLRERSRLASELRSKQHPNIAEHRQQQQQQTSELRAICRILASRSHVELGRLMTGDGRPYRRLGFNFYSLVKETLNEADRTELETVECRFLEGTMAEDVILGWLQIFGSLVQSALAGVPRQEDAAVQPDLMLPLLGLLEQTCRCPTATTDTFVHLMEDLGVGRSSFAPVLAIIHRARRMSTGAEGLLVTGDNSLRPQLR